MTLDKEEHRLILLELINKTAFQGQFVEQVVELKKAIVDAGCVEESISQTIASRRLGPVGAASKV